ncbi:Peroxisomal S-2-hydroxy-acid oxidase [Hondaea fermentalgiana]|uniref:Peroxisomal S-2-hydroxy-acid oxidase n=1 Tax=Hondaea fermentalgiana TaxID=2315210 RepID=A0A2R5GMW6_9STRA|nr:Peroxisomal S-2-hydroxy-acid oxidase [Hondaea fermentalgiana]|eukprot:GBG29973.1 Peroxisomal S-2-hydroxy-acid oxidase [Hondaea fermentalgiana]
MKKRWTWAEVAARTSRATGVLVVVDDVVYDVSEFVDVHPGGAQVLLDAAGADASAAFHAAHDPALLASFADMAVGRILDDASADTLGEGSMQERLARFQGSAAQGGAAPPKPTLSILDLHERAVSNLPPAVLAYVDLGAEDEESLRENVQAWAAFALRPRVLCDVSRCSTTLRVKTKFIHIETDSPIGIAPFAGAAIVDPERAEGAIAQAATAQNALYVLPHYASVPLEELALVAPRFLQLYAPVCSAQDPSVDFDYLETIIAHVADHISAVQAIVLTVDSPTFGNREKTYRNPAWIAQLQAERGGMPKLRALEAIDGIGKHPGHSPALSWKDIARLRDLCHTHGLGLVLKGILALPDALHAASLGVDGLMISNHGGRQLDAALATASAAFGILPPLRNAFPELPVWVDGGIRRGKDVFRALAMGCTGVLVGRPVLWGLAAEGQLGVQRALKILKEELVTVMKLAGCARLADIGPEHIALGMNKL